MKMIRSILKNVTEKKARTIFISIFLLFDLFFLSAWSFWKSPPPEPRDATFSPDGQYLIFPITYKKHSHIYRVRKDGSELTRLTISPGNDFDPVYSPDGARIVFSRTQSTKYAAPASLCIMDAKGSNIIPLTMVGHDRDTASVFSPDGTRVYFNRARWFGRHSPFVSQFWQNKDIFSTRPDGSDVKAVTNKSFYKLSRPSISPDGKGILVSLTVDKIMNALWIIPVEDAKAMRLIKPEMMKYRNKKKSENAEESAGYQSFYTPLFFPDGKSLVFSWSAETMEHGYYEYEIYRMNQGTKEVQRLTNLGRNATPTDISPDGKEIVFLFDPNWPKGGKPYELWLMNSDGTNPHRINVDLKNCLNCAN